MAQALAFDFSGAPLASYLPPASPLPPALSAEEGSAAEGSFAFLRKGRGLFRLSRGGFSP